jgi:hypothetical protein
MDLTRALELQPVFLSAHAFRSLARYVTEDYRGAIADVTEVLKFPDIEPQDLARHFYTRAMSYEATGDTELAAQDFEAAKLHDPDGRILPR